MPVIDISKAKSLRAAPDEQTANRLISAGWVLIDSASGQDESGYPIVRFSLAWLSDNPIPSDY